MKDYTSIYKWEDEYKGAGIYSLVDECGKRYIGQSINVDSRLNRHRRELNKVYNGKTEGINEGAKLIEAAKHGKRFKVEILHKLLFSESTVNELRKWEAHYLDKYGGLDETYNSEPIPYPNYSYEPFNEVTLTIDCDGEIVAHLQAINEVQGYIKDLIRADIKKK